MGDSPSPRNSAGRKRSNDGANDDPSGKKMKNREAARKCREKKVKETEDLRQKNTDLMEKNKDLSRRKDELEKTLHHFILEIKKHKSSGCVLPKKVEDIINLPEFAEGFIPVGTRTISPQNNILDNYAFDSDRADSIQIDSDNESEVATEEIRPTIKGLFTGEHLPVPAVEKSRIQRSSSRSPSRSPPAPPVASASRSHVVASSVSSPSSSSSSSSLQPSRLANGTSQMILQPSWNRLHQQTMNGAASPGLSPVQTVPNIDPVWEAVPDAAYPKHNGFPDIREAVRCAQKDPGVMEDVEYSNHRHNIQYQGYASPSSSGSDRTSLGSLGFAPNVTMASGGSFQYTASLDNDSNRYSPAAVSDALKPSTSSSSTISMNYTAELLSQAITNFDASEISEDLKKQYVQLSKPQAMETINELQQNQQNYVVSNDLLDREENNEVQQPIASSTQVSAAEGNDISYENLLQLAKGQENITVQYQGREYLCNYEQVEELIKYISGQKAEEQANAQLAHYHGESTVTHLVESKDFISQANDNAYIVQNQNHALQNTLAAMNGSAINNVDTASSSATAVQATHLPTTVLSMIEEDSQQSQNQSGTLSETYVESVDYSENVCDLPSLSLTEDHTNIFEKRRKNT